MKGKSIMLPPIRAITAGGNRGEFFFNARNSHRGCHGGGLGICFNDQLLPHESYRHRAASVATATIRFRYFAADLVALSAALQYHPT